MAKKWKIKELANSTLPEMPEYPKLIVRLLALRGITTGEQIEDFLNPEYEQLLDPNLFKDMPKAVERIRLAVANQERVAIYADYDADAITACSVMYHALKKLGLEAIAYIPDRFSEGYGMNVEAIKKLSEDNVKLIITVDCGINAVTEAQACIDTGIDLIITDHHEVTGPLPQALAIINPKNPEDNYPYPFLTGVGVAYKVVQALFRAEGRGIRAEEKPSDSSTLNPLPLEGWEKWLLDLVAIGTVADCQSLIGENRVLVSYGLKVLAKTRWPGIKALLEVAELKDQNYDSFTLGFILGPRINAAGRIQHADSAFKLLIADDMETAKKLALELNDLNKRRQMLTEQVLSDARSQAELQADKKVIMVSGSDWPKGVVGLIAGRLTEEYNRPALVISIDSEGVGTGSARSTEDFDIVAGLGFAKDVLMRFGGHTQAAGFSVAQNNIEPLRGKLMEFSESINFSLSDATINIDATVLPEDITWDTIEKIEKLSPFGIGNPKPKLSASSLKVIDYRLVGGDKHLKLTLSFGSLTLAGIAFNQGFHASRLQPGSLIDAVFELGSNEWNGRKDMQLRIIDLKII